MVKRALIITGVCFLLFTSQTDVAATSFQPDSTSIYVQDASRTTCLGPVSLGYFIKHSLPNEWFQSDHPEALKAGAIAIRTYIFHPEISFDWPVGSENYKCVRYEQVAYDEGRPTYASTDAATDSTDGQHMDDEASNTIILAKFNDANGDPTNPCDVGQGNCPPPGEVCPGLNKRWYYSSDYPYLASIPDPVTPERGVLDCLAAGMAQIGSNRWATGSDPTPDGPTHPAWSDYRQLLTHYYTDIHVRDASGNALTPPWRWNALQHNTPLVMDLDRGPYRVDLWVHNTGTARWGYTYIEPLSSGLPARYRQRLTYRWYDASGTILRWDPGTGTQVPFSAQPVDPGEDVTFDDVTVTVPGWFTPNRYYVLKWDMQTQLEGTSEWLFFSAQGPDWPQQEVRVYICQGQGCNKVYLPLTLRNYGG